jgi:hypothetical protein
VRKLHWRALPEQQLAQTVFASFKVLAPHNCPVAAQMCANPSRQRRTRALTVQEGPALLGTAELQRLTTAFTLKEDFAATATSAPSRQHCPT